MVAIKSIKGFSDSHYRTRIVLREVSILAQLTKSGETTYVPKLYSIIIPRKHSTFEKYVSSPQAPNIPVMATNAGASNQKVATENDDVRIENLNDFD